MSQLVVKKNGKTLPAVLSDFFDTDRLFETGFFDPDLRFFPAMRKIFNMPSANFTEKEKEYLIDLAAPGLEKKDFKIEVDNNLLTISAEKEEKTEEKEEGFTRKEYSFNSFSRSFRLPENSFPDKIWAEYKDGILKVMIPKKEIMPAKAAKKIQVK